MDAQTKFVSEKKRAPRPSKRSRVMYIHPTVRPPDGRIQDRTTLRTPEGFVQATHGPSLSESSAYETRPFASFPRSRGQTRSGVRSRGPGADQRCSNASRGRIILAMGVGASVQVFARRCGEDSRVFGRPRPSFAQTTRAAVGEGKRRMPTKTKTHRVNNVGERYTRHAWSLPILWRRRTIPRTRHRLK